MRRMAIVMPVLAAGCAATGTVWVKSGSTQQDFNIDQRQCQAQAFSAPDASTFRVGLVYDSCMHDKGYQLEWRPFG